MAIFNEINKRSGLVVGAVVLALALFLLTDLFFGQNSIFKSSDNKIGEIAGENISREEYIRQLSIAEQNYTMQTNKSVSENERGMVQENAWNQLIFDIAYRDEFEKLGITVTDEEWYDLARGEFIHPMVKQLFGNPENFSKEMVNGFIANLSKARPQDQALWYYVDTKLPEMRIREKYTNLLKNTTYVTKAEAKRDYISSNQKANVNYLNIPFFNIPDSTVSVSDSELNQYLEKNAQNYKVEAGRTIDYIVFNVEPTKEDSLALSEDLNNIKTEFQNTLSDSNFVQFNSDEPVAIKFVRMNELAKGLQNEGNLDTGKVYGPFLQNNLFKLYKVIGTKQDTIFSARASHILFKPAGGGDEGKAKAKENALEILNKIKAGASFEEMAKEYGTDATAPEGGDLGWFTEGMMVGPFNDAVFSTRNKGLLPNLVETQFGYHIIKITETKTKEMYKVAEVNRTVSYSEETKERVYQKAVAFASDLEDSTDFYNKIKENDSLILSSAPNLRPNDRNLNQMRNARKVIKWAYAEAEPGDVSEVFSVDDQFVVAVLKSAREAGTARLEDVKDEVANKVRMEKKAQIILEKLKGQEGSFEEIAKAYGSEAKSGKADGVTLSSNYVSGLGYDPVVVGRIFGLDVNEKSGPIEGQSGVAMVEPTKVDEPKEIADYSANKNKISQKRSGRTDVLINEAIKEEADIEDERYKFQ